MQSSTGILALACATALAAQAAPALAQAPAVPPMPAAATPAPSPLNRPQTPEPPFPYQSVEVSFDSAPGVKIAGTLTLPQGKGPFPVAVLINGSGRVDRDEITAGHRPFLVLADDLTRRGIAVLRYDKRGLGYSTGRSPTVTTADFVVDAKAAVAFLRARADIDPKRVGLLGHEEGGTIASMVASEDAKVAFVVMLASSGVRGDELLIGRHRANLAAEGVPAEKIASAEKADRQAYDLAKSDLADAALETRLEALATSVGAPPAQVKTIVAPMVRPWFRAVLRYDPTPTLSKLRCPVLAIDGSKDVEVVAGQNLPAIRAALKDDPDATVQELPGLNHLFQEAQTGLPREYGKIEETISPTALKLIGEWVVKRAGGG